MEAAGPTRRPTVAIVGGGFAGLEAARTLDGKPVEVLLIDSRNHHLFTPLLYQVATALLDPSQIAVSLRSVFRRSRNVRVVQGEVSRVQRESRTLVTADGTAFAYDYLVLATGSQTAYFGHPELAESTIGMKSLEEALRLRSHVLAALEQAARLDDEEREEWLTVVVVGGGPAGVEYAGALAELLRLVLGNDYPEIRPDDAKVVIVDNHDRPLRMFSPRASSYATHRLRHRDPFLRGTLAARRHPDAFSFSMLRRIEPDFVPNVGVSASGALMVVSLILFLFFFGR